MSETSEQPTLPDLFRKAEAAVTSGDARTASRLTGELLTRFPDRPHGYQLAAQSAIDSGDLDRAETILAEGVEQCAVQYTLLTLQATIAERRGNHDGAFERWEKLLSVMPNHPRGLAGLAGARMAKGDFAGAEAVLSEALVVHPEDFFVVTFWASVASRRGDWATALFRWSRARELFPQVEGVRNEFATAQEQWEQDAAINYGIANGADVALHARAQIAPTADPEVRAVMLGFESLGSNCEFGLVQRRFEAEPLGLLRWAFTHHGALRHLLATRFVNFCLADKVKLRTETVTNEWSLYDESSQVSFHTFVSKGSTEESAFIEKQLKRLRWLRQKLIDELESGEKIFVYSAGGQAVPESSIRETNRLMKAYGPTTLLWVSVAEAGQMPGSVEVIEDGLLRGFISAFGAVNGRWDIKFDEWVALCRQARRIKGSDADPSGSGHHARPCPVPGY